MSLLRPGLSILSTQMKLSLQYRLGAWAQLTTNIFWGFVHVVIIIVFYRYGERSGAEASMTLAQAVSYIWLGQIAIHLLPGYAIDPEIRDKIRNGDVGVELCRPLDLYFHWYVRAAASRCGRFLLQVIPVAAVAMLLPEPYRLQPPASLLGFLASCASLFLGLLLSCALIGISYVLLMQVNWGDGPVILLRTASEMLSGNYLPLQLWPVWAQRFLAAQPFASLMDLPLRFYLGTLPPSALLRVGPMQIGWTLLFIAIGWLTTQMSLRRLVVQGG